MFQEYKDDPEGKINLLGRTFGDRYTRTILDTIRTFSKDDKIILFAEKFCGGERASPATEFCRDQILDWWAAVKSLFA